MGHVMGFLRSLYCHRSSFICMLPCRSSKPWSTGQVWPVPVFHLACTMFKKSLSQHFEIGSFHIKLQISGISQKLRRSGNTGFTLPHSGPWLVGQLLPPLDRHAFSVVRTGPLLPRPGRFSSHLPHLLFLCYSKTFLSTSALIKSGYKCGKNSPLQILFFTLIHGEPISLLYLPVKLKQRCKKLVGSVSYGRFSEACLLVCSPSRDQIRLHFRKAREKGRMERQLRECAGFGSQRTHSCVISRLGDTGTWTPQDIIFCLTCQALPGEGARQRLQGWRKMKGLDPFLLVLLTSSLLAVPVCITPATLLYLGCNNIRTAVFLYSPNPFPRVAPSPKLKPFFLSSKTQFPRTPRPNFKV